MLPYCRSLTRTLRRPTREVMIGRVAVGGNQPIRIQSMTTTDTKDVAATVAQSIALAEAGCEIVRITAPNVTAARCLRDIRRELDRQKIDVPLVADIHFLPAAAMEAVEHVEKVRINPGNYADRKKFSIREYSDTQYDEELQRLYEAFSPLVKRCKELGRSMRIGTNHGSLSDRIMNRYGDSPLGMVESALEFLRICESHGYHDIILSMKASNPKVMIHAYRLLVARMNEENMHYPLHLGVTEAGDGEDGRIKSSIGIGSLLADGLGDTIRVSLTEDPVYEIPVARALADAVMSQWRQDPVSEQEEDLSFLPSPYTFERRTAAPVAIGRDLTAGGDQPPRVLVALTEKTWRADRFADRLRLEMVLLKDTPVEGLILPVSSPREAEEGIVALLPLGSALKSVVLDLGSSMPWPKWADLRLPAASWTWVVARRLSGSSLDEIQNFLSWCCEYGAVPALGLDEPTATAAASLLAESSASLILFLDHHPNLNQHAIGGHRRLLRALRANGIAAPLWIRNTRDTVLHGSATFLDCLIEASLLSGSLLCDGMGDLLSIETEDDPIRATKLTYNVLQGAGARISKTEFVACPSCGRTLFDLQTTTQRIRDKTGHLKGVKIAIMGCIVNGPGEMADADFGYVGGAPGRVNLYVGKECVRYHVPQEQAVERLIDLIKDRGKWVEPEADIAPAPASAF
jgi:(E)-4-hydroxy-3-methylbut-2-enyl-diphosphate synthase